MATSFPEDVASPVDEPKPKTARAPIDRDVCSLFHFKSVPNAICAAATWYHADLPVVPMLDRRRSEDVASLLRAAIALELIYRGAISMI